MEKINKKLGVSYFYKYIELILILYWGFALLFVAEACANIITISDEETELYLADIIRPIFEVAEIPFNRDKIFIVEDNSLNAFVSDGNNLFINTEVILQAQNSDEIRGVIAHEAGHVLGGHIIRYKLKQQELQTLSLASMVIAGALGAVSGRGDVAAAIAIGSQNSLLTKSLSYRIEEERNADEAAVMLLKKAGYSPIGLLNFMKKIQRHNMLQGISENKYFSTHPQNDERIAFLKQAVKNSKQTFSKQNDDTLNRIKAKIYAFVKSPQQTHKKYTKTNKSINARYAQAIAAYKGIEFQKAIKLINELINEEPSNPHFRELKGQILLEQGKIKEAEKEFKISSKLLPSSMLFKINVAQCLLENNPSKQDVQKTIIQLQKVLIKKQTLYAWLLLSRAYEMNGDKADAMYAAAEYSIRIGNVTLAKKQAEKAKAISKSPTLNLKIDDLLQHINNQRKK